MMYVYGTTGATYLGYRRKFFVFATVPLVPFVAAACGYATIDRLHYVDPASLITVTNKWQ